MINLHKTLLESVLIFFLFTNSAIFAQGADNDFAASIEEVEKGMLNISEPKILDVIESCDHFYIDREIEIANRVFNFFNHNKTR